MGEIEVYSRCQRRITMRQARTVFSLGLIMLLSILYLAGFCLSDERKSPSPKFSLKLTGGARYVAVGDLNEYLGSFNQRPDICGKVAEIANWSSDWEVELRIRLSSRFGLGLATSGFFNKKSPSSIYFYGGNIGDPEITKSDSRIEFVPEIKAAMPLGLNLYYSLCSGSRMNLFVDLGLGWYTGRMTENYIDNTFQSDGRTYFGTFYWSVDNNFSLGIQGGLGLEYAVTDELALVVEVQGRYARISSLKGKICAMSNNSLYEETGTLYSYQWAWFGTGPWYRELMVHESPPEGGIFSVKDVREARLDLSGFALRIGLRVRLF
jgi:opacity protein-like surface antigen